MSIVLRAFACALLVASGPALARLTSIEVSSVEPLAPGSSFGDAGSYERVKGVFRGELDPQDARNRVIVNLDKAPRNASGKVEYEADFFMLRPADSARGNGKIVYDVTNRGRLNFHWRFTQARKPSNNPTSADDVGDGLFFQHGYTFVWSGWDPDAPTRGNGLAMKPVVASNVTDPLGTRDVELPPNARAYRLAGTQHGAGVVDDFDARLLRQHAQPARTRAAPAGAFRCARRMGRWQSPAAFAHPAPEGRHADDGG